MRDVLAFGHPQRQQRPSPLLRIMVGGVLRRTRRSQDRTLADVARSARISMQYLSELERGRKEASSEILAAVCAALRIDLSELIAAVGHDLLDQRARPGLRPLDTVRDGPGQPGRPDAPLPDQSGASLAPPSVIPLAQPATPASDEPGASSRRPGDAVCLLAA